MGRAALPVLVAALVAAGSAFAQAQTQIGRPEPGASVPGSPGGDVPPPPPPDAPLPMPPVDGTEPAPMPGDLVGPTEPGMPPPLPPDTQPVDPPFPELPPEDGVPGRPPLPGVVGEAIGLHHRILELTEQLANTVTEHIERARSKDGAREPRAEARERMGALARAIKRLERRLVKVMNRLRENPDLVPPEAREQLEKLRGRKQELDELVGNRLTELKDLSGRKDDGEDEGPSDEEIASGETTEAAGEALLEGRAEEIVDVVKMFERVPDQQVPTGSLRRLREGARSR